MSREDISLKSVVTCFLNQCLFIFCWVPHFTFTLDINLKVRYLIIDRSCTIKKYPNFNMIH